MSLSKLAGFAATLLCGAVILAFPSRGVGQTNYYSAYGSEYLAAGAMPGDQVFPDVAVRPAGGLVVWQDNVTDGSGWGISAQRLDSTFSPTLSSFRVNVQGTGNQEKPRVAMLKNGGAAFVWQGGTGTAEQIFARLLTPTNTWLTATDVVVSVRTNSLQVTPALAVLNNSNVVVVWASYNQAGSNSMMDVYGKILSPTGQTVSNAFLINQFTTYNQRNPAVAALAGGGFVVTWISEQERVTAPNYGSPSGVLSASTLVRPSVDVYARLFASNGAAATNEFLVNQSANPCATPAVAAGSDGGFMITWAAHDVVAATNSWDIFARPFSSAGVGGTAVAVNSYTYGDQYNPRISAIGLDYMVVFTSLGQDGSREGVFGQYVHNNGSLTGSEFLVNTTTAGQQMQPAVASDGTYQFEAVWAGFDGLANGFDVYGQRYDNVTAILQPMAAPFVIAPFNLVSNKYVPQLDVTWPQLAGISVSNFEVYVDGAASPAAVVATNLWVMGPVNGLAASGTHSFQVDYVTTDGRRSPISPSASGSTWSGLNYYGIPNEWMEQYYGDSIGSWPSATAPVVPGGPTLDNIFLSGGDPLDSTTWLTVSVTRAAKGCYVSWNTQPGLTYQVQVSTDFKNWSNVGSARFAAGITDSIFVGDTPVGYYHVMLLRP